MVFNIIKGFNLLISYLKIYIFNIKMELINQIDETIAFNESNIRVIGSYDKPWFVAKDICNILELKDVSNALLNIPDKWKGTKVISTLGGKQDMRIINESGLYKLIMRSNKSIAQKFQDFVCDEILPSIRQSGEFKLKQLLDDKEKQIKSLENKILNKQNRVQYKDKNCIYILTTDFHLKNRTYIIGETVNLTHRLSSYNKTSDHHVIFTKGCKSIEHMHVVEKMVLYKLDKYRERANRDRFILPEDKDISFFIDIVNDAISWFDDIEEYVREYTDGELNLSNEELQKKYIQSIKDHEFELKLKKSDTDRTYRENNKEKKAEIDRIYRENNTEKIAERKKEYYENNKTEILSKQKEHYDENKTEILERQKEYHNTNKVVINKVRKIYREENKDKIKGKKRIYREKYKDEINKKQNEKRKENPIPVVECVCGIKLKLTNSKGKKHLNSKAHKKYLEDNKKINKVDEVNEE
jgi:prophage antirepressor-like protein